LNLLPINPGLSHWLSDEYEAVVNSGINLGGGGFQEKYMQEQAWLD